MRFAAGLALIATLSSCAFAVRHPAVTAGIAGAIIAGGTCELSTRNASGGGGEEGWCTVTAGAAGVGLGLIVATAIWLGGDGHTILWDEKAPPEPPTKTFVTAPPPAPPPPRDVAPPPPVEAPPTDPAAVDAELRDLVARHDELSKKIHATAEKWQHATTAEERDAVRQELSALSAELRELKARLQRLRPEQQLPQPIEQRECPPDLKIPCA